MGYPSNELAFAQATAFTRRVAELWWSDFEERLLGVYRIGSLAHRGFSARYSDIDMAVIAADPLATEDVERMRELAAGASRELAAKLSIFWTDRLFRIGRFPPLDRVDYLDHADPILEHERVLPARPSLADIREYLRGEPFQGWATQVRHYSVLPALSSSDHKPYLRCLLYPARLLYSWTTGALASNDDAVEFLRRHPVPRLDLDLILRALRCRQEARDADHLFPERSRLNHQYSVCAEIIARPQE
jgi:predicted nucleotidyltransferase